MDKLDELIAKLDFKRILKYYITFSVILLLSCLLSIAYMSRDKIYMTMDYIKVSRAFEKEGINDNLKLQLDKLVLDSNDVRNAVILSKDNSIIYKVNNNLVNNETNLQLIPYEYEKNYLEDNLNRDVIYKVVGEENIILNTDYIKNSQDIATNVGEDFFYERDINSKKIYLLNYLVNSDSGKKVFIFRTANPIPYAERLMETTGTVLGIILALYWIGLALWVYKDAMGKKIKPSLWGIIVLLTNLVGLLAYIMLKQNSRICLNCGAMQSKENAFCTRCGAKINSLCNQCGNIIAKDDNFCSKCGDKF